MAINGGDVKFSFTGDSSDLNAALAKAGKNLDGLTVAGQGAANKIGKDLNTASIKSSKSLHNFTESAGDADSVMMGLAGAIDLVNPALGDMVRTSGDALAGTEAMGRAIKFSNPIFIALSVAAAALGAAYFFLKEDTVEAEAAAKALKEQQEALNKVYEESEGKILAYDRKLAVLTGTMTELNAQFQTMQEGAQKEFLIHINKMELALASARSEVLRTEEAYDANKMSITAHTKAVEAARDIVIGYEREIRKLNKQQREQVEAAGAAMLAAKNKADEDKEATEAVKAHADAVKKASADRIAAEKAAVEAAKEAAENIAGFQEETLADLMAESERIGNARIAAREEFVAAQIVINKELDADAEKEIARINKVASAELKAFEDRLNYAGDFTNATGDLAVALSERLGATAEDQAMTAYIVAQTTALAQIAISTAVSAAKAAEQTGILAAVTVPAMYALGAVQAAAVLATPPPKFHSGGMAPDERLITAQTGEAVLSRSGVAAAGGASGVNNLNRGGGGGAIVVVNQYRHRVFDSFIMDNLRRTGSPLAAAIGATGNKAGILR